MVAFHQQLLLQQRYFGVVSKAILAGECCDVWHYPDRNCLSVPDLAAPLTALPACCSFVPAPPVRRTDAPVLFLLGHGHGTYEFCAPRVAERPRCGVEAKNGRNGDDLRRQL